jgi:hypothetical protein
LIWRREGFEPSVEISPHTRFHKRYGHHALGIDNSNNTIKRLAIARNK